jgi:hypothetical protein
MLKEFIKWRHLALNIFYRLADISVGDLAAGND